MSEPIKLKFWCNDHNFVEAGFGEPITEVHFNQRGELGLACPLCFKSRPMTIVRYTGLQDENGVDIYEGDILATTIKGAQRVLPGEVRMENGCWAVGEMGDVWTVHLRCEIIGNIYEHPHLLESTS